MAYMEWINQIRLLCETSTPLGSRSISQFIFQTEFGGRCTIFGTSSCNYLSPLTNVTGYTYGFYRSLQDFCQCYRNLQNFYGIFVKSHKIPVNSICTSCKNRRGLITRGLLKMLHRQWNLVQVILF